MTNVGTPDWQRGIISPEMVIGRFVPGDDSESVTMPPNTETLLILTTAVAAFVPPTVVGNTTNTHYPVSRYPLQPGGSTNPVYVVAVASAADPAVTITWPGMISASWFVVADAGIRQVIDTTLADMVQSAEDTAGSLGLLAMGSDGTDARVLLTDSEGRLVPEGALLYYQAFAPNAGQVLAAPAAGTTYQIYSIDARAATADVQEYRDSAGNTFASTEITTANGIGTTGPLGPVRVALAFTMNDMAINQSVNVTVRYSIVPA